MDIILGINASRAKSGGAVAHLSGLLREGNPQTYGIKEVHVWSYKELLSSLPASPWLVKHDLAVEGRSLAIQLLWERFTLPSELARSNVSILLNVDAGSVCRFKPAVTMSRDMLSYEPGEIERYGWGKARLRLIALRYIQDSSLRHASGAIFLTRYAASVIQRSCGELAKVAFIPHGVASIFSESNPGRAREGAELRCLYVSNCAPYKHQWNVVSAMKSLRDKGHDLTLSLVGGGKGKALERLHSEINRCDPGGEFVREFGFLSQEQLIDHYENADIFIFASSCENMPNTLLEAMAVGLPIACSKRGPMPEVLEDCGEYFDPEDSTSIANSVESLVKSLDLRERLSARAKTMARQYSWQRCSEQTFEFVSKVYNDYR